MIKRLISALSSKIDFRSKKIFKRIGLFITAAIFVGLAGGVGEHVGSCIMEKFSLECFLPGPDNSLTENSDGSLPVGADVKNLPMWNEIDQVDRLSKKRRVVVEKIKEYSKLGDEYLDHGDEIRARNTFNLVVGIINYWEIQDPSVIQRLLWHSYRFSAYFDIADSYSKRNDIKNALDIYENIVFMFDSLQKKSLEYAALFAYPVIIQMRMSELYLDPDYKDRAIELTKTILNIWEEMGKGSPEISMFTAYGYSLLHQVEPNNNWLAKIVADQIALEKLVEDDSENIFLRMSLLVTYTALIELNVCGEWEEKILTQRDEIRRLNQEDLLYDGSEDDLQDLIDDIDRHFEMAKRGFWESVFDVVRCNIFGSV